MNKTGASSLIAGLAILVIVWYFDYYPQTGHVLSSLASLVVNGIIIGGIAWLGLILAVLGVLILSI